MTNTITLPRSVVEQALEALEIGHESARDCAETFHVEMAGYKQQRHEALDVEVKQISDTIDALRAALEQPQGAQEPVAFWCEGSYFDTEEEGLKYLSSSNCLISEELTPLYLGSQTKREPLTEADLYDIAGNYFADEWAQRKAVMMLKDHGIGGKS